MFKELHLLPIISTLLLTVTAWAEYLETGSPDIMNHVSFPNMFASQEPSSSVDPPHTMLT